MIREVENGITKIDDRVIENNQIKSVKIPESVVEIGKCEFSTKRITKVEIAEGVTKIGPWAFANNLITSIRIPGSVVEIGESAFRRNKITKVEIAEGVTKIRSRAFEDNQITSVIIPESVVEIGESAFENNQITSVIIPRSVVEIGESAFENNQITSVIIPESVAKIGYSAFDHNQITSVRIPESVVEIGEFAFRNNQITNVKIPGSVAKIGYGAFMGNQITSVRIPESVVEIGEFAFENNQIKSVKIPESVVKIGKNAFCNNQISEVEIAEGVIEIGFLAFFDNQITSVRIPESVAKIGKSAFAHNPLTNIYLPKKISTVSMSSFDDCNLKEMTFYSTLKNISSDYNYSDNSFREIEEITIIEADYKYLTYFEEKMLGFFPNVKKINLKNFLVDLFDVKEVNFSNPNVKINIQNVIIDNSGVKNITNKFNLSQETLELIMQIYEAINLFPVKKQIEAAFILKEIINNYEKNISKNEPQFDLKQTSNFSLEVDNKDLKSIEIQMIVSLQSLLYNLNSQSQSIKDLEKLKKYINILNELEEPDNDIENKIKKILEISKKLNFEKSSDYLKDLISKTEQKIVSSINFDLSIKLVYTDCILELENKINNMYEKYSQIWKKIKPYFQLKEQLTKGDFANIKEIKNVLNRLDSFTKNKYDKILNKLEEDFITKINNCIEITKNNKEADSINELETEFKNQLNPILVELKEDALKYERNGKLLNELKQSLNILKNENVDEVDGSIYETVVDIKGLTQNLNKNEREQTNLEVENIIIKWLKIVQENNYAELVKNIKKKDLI